MNTINQQLVEKWRPILEHENFPTITDPHVMSVTATLLENTEQSISKGEDSRSHGLLSENVIGPVNNTGNVSNYDPILISLIRRAMPNLIAYDIASVQPMTGPTGLIFAFRPEYVNPANTQVTTPAFYNEPDTAFSGANNNVQGSGLGSGANTTVTLENAAYSTGFDTRTGEQLGSQGGSDFNEMSFRLDSVTVSAVTRALKGEYTDEQAADLQAIHGLNAENEIANMLISEILGQINREVVRTIYSTAVTGSTLTTNPGVFNLDVDANGRHLTEKFKGLMFNIELESHAIAKATRRGRGNILVCSSPVASALQMAGVLDYTPALNSNNLNPDDTGNTFAGVLNGRYRVYVDPYSEGDYMVVGYKGSNAFDAGLFYCPYQPLKMVRAVGENSFQPKVGFKTRYGMVANPFAPGSASGNGALVNNTNVYYRRTLVRNLL